MTVKKSLTEAILKQHFKKKKQETPGFSARQIAKKLEISHSYISQILNGKRNLPSDILDDLCEILDIDPERKEILAVEILKNQGWSKTPQKNLRKFPVKTKSHSGDWVQASSKDLNLLENWYYLALLEATQLSDYDGTSEFLAKRLGLEVHNVRHTMDKLARAGYLEKDDRGFLFKKSALLEFQSRRSRKEIANYHVQTLEKTKAIMKNQTSSEDLQKRLISSSTFTCSREQVSVLRLKVAEFIKEITIEGSQQSPEEVYIFGTFLIPLTEAAK